MCKLYVRLNVTNVKNRKNCVFFNTFLKFLELCLWLFLNLSFEKSLRSKLSEKIHQYVRFTNSLYFLKETRDGLIIRIFRNRRFVIFLLFLRKRCWYFVFPKHLNICHCKFRFEKNLFPVFLAHLPFNCLY